MVDQVIPTTELPQDYVRQTQHRAVYQSASQAPAATQPIDSYQPPSNQDFTSTPTQPVAPVVASTPPQPAASQSSKSTNTPAATQPSSAASKAQPSDIFPGVNKPVPEEFVVTWDAPSRPFKDHKRQYYTTIFIFAGLICAILLFVGQPYPILVVLAVAFLTYVLAVVPPGIVRHSLTTYGVRVENQLYYWEELGRFWFSAKHGQNMVHIEVARFPWRLTLLLDTIPVEDMTLVLSEVLIKQKPPLTPIEKAAEWLQEKIPLDAD